MVRPPNLINTLALPRNTIHVAHPLDLRVEVVVRPQQDAELLARVLQLSRSLLDAPWCDALDAVDRTQQRLLNVRVAVRVLTA